MQTAKVFEVLAVDVDPTRHEGDELLVITAHGGAYDQSAEVYDLRGCRFVPVLNGEGAPYTFLLGDGDGSDAHPPSGVGCYDVDEDGLVDLVGTAVVGGDKFDNVTLRRTVVRLRDGVFRNGPTDTVVVKGGGAGDAYRRERSASCGAREPVGG